MKQVYYILILVFFYVFSCVSSKSTASPKQIEALADLINNKKFSIESNWAYPQATYAMQQVLNSRLLQPGNNANAISLIGNSNFLTISGDSISSYLPYYGERQMQVQYGGGDSAIEFNGLMEDYKTIKNENESYTISFKTKSKSENFNISIVIFPNLRSEIILNGTTRFTIRYSGTVKNIVSE